MATDDKPSPADRLERALRQHEEAKRAAAEVAAKNAPEAERERARLVELHAKLEGLPERERRKVLDAAGFPRVSAAPTPLTPIRGSGPMPEANPARIAPRWAVWHALPNVEIWQAVLLSLDIEPHEKLREELSRPRFNAPMFNRLPAEALDRLKACQQAISVDGPIRPQGPLWSGMRQSKACPVLLAEVATFLVRCEFPIPEVLRQVLPVDAPPTNESKEEREDRRLEECERAGLPMPESHLGRLPDGIGKVATAAGISRQAYSDDVKAALKRREKRRRAGDTTAGR